MLQVDDLEFNKAIEQLSLQNSGDHLENLDRSNETAAGILFGNKLRTDQLSRRSICPNKERNVPHSLYRPSVLGNNDIDDSGE